MSDDTTTDAAAARLSEIEARLAKLPPDDWCAVIPPAGVDPAEFHYGYGELRTVPTEDGEGWSLLLKVDDHDEQDAVLEFCAGAKRDIPYLTAQLRDAWAATARLTAELAEARRQGEAAQAVADALAEERRLEASPNSSDMSASLDAVRATDAALAAYRAARQQENSNGK